MNIELAEEDALSKSSEGIEFALLRFGSEHNINNIYHWCSQQLGYKSLNYMYRLVRNIGDMKIKDLRMLVHITNNDSLWDMARNGC